MRILIKENQSVMADLSFDPQPVHIGSQPDCQIHLPDMRVAQHHALLSPQDDGQWVLAHLAGGAYSKTQINGHSVQGLVRVNNADQISIADFQLQVYLEMESRRLDEGIKEVRIIDEFPLPPGSVTRSKRKDVVLTAQRLDDAADFVFNLGSCGDIASVMDCALKELMRVFKARAVWMGVRRQPRGELEFIQGRDYRDQVYEKPRLYDAVLYRCMSRGINVWVPSFSDEETQSIIAAPLVTPAGRLGLVYVDSLKNGRALTEQDLDYLILMCCHIAKQLQAVIGEQLKLRKTLASAEDSIVQAVQAKLDPHLVPEWPDLQVAVHCSPGEAQAGDMYDVMELPNGASAFLLAHVNAPAVVAAIAMVETRTAFRIAVLHADLPHVILGQLSWMITRQPEKVRMHCAIVMVDPRNGAMLYSVAGQPVPAVIGQSGQPRRLECTAAPELGTVPNFEYKTRKGILGLDESLVLYTSGVPKMQDSDGHELGEERFLDCLCDGFGMPARKVLNETLADLGSFFETGYRPEDVTIMLAHRTRSTTPTPTE